MGEALIKRYAAFDGAEILEPLLTRYYKGRIALVSSFGAESAVLLHMAAQIDPTVPVISLETGKLFDETRAYRTRLIDHLRLTNVRIVRPDANALDREDPAGELHRTDPDLCCHIRKTEPLDAALSGFDAWVSGRKRFHGAGRAHIPAMEMADGRLKVEPLARYSAADLEAYMTYYDLPRHPLVEQGYRSIGCVPCTVKGGTTDNPRAGRWAGSAKTECGIHWTANGRPLRVA
jgi:phosphoadenosine phosphosulfate reductase